MSAKSIERLKKEDAKQFVSKNFPNYDLILRNFDQITFGKVESDKEKNPFKIKKDGKTLGEVQLFVIPIHMPFLKDSADNKNGSDGHGIYSRLKFVTFDGKTYWVPFGW